MSRFDEIYPVLHEYDMYAQSIDVIKGPNVYKAITPYGSYVCKRSSASIGRILFVGGVLRHLQQRGWEGAVPLMYTKYDEPYVQRGESVFTLTPYRPAVPVEESQVSAWAAATAVRLAELHHLTQNYRFDDPRQVEPLVDSLLARWESWLTQLELYKATAVDRQYPSPFDVVFLANYDFIWDTAKQAVNELREWRRRHETHAHFRLSLIHGFPHPAHTLLDPEGNARLLNFDRAVFDSPVRDLTMFYRTYFQMAGDDEVASEVYREYANVFPLRPDEIELLSCFLQYPERIMRDVESYYEQKRNWNELTAVKRLEKDIDRLMRLNRWVNRAF
ncbi:aminoglycoside phosphotransferase family protein [Brevibacillus dissolubilis]|uniref:aminoglycoside phosphotransferase family protein n=1 Tax=Brevibacillus dissolubilis TaxID=1844116 RepID=UPI001116A972|nr:aminoglycoside phosphotransferase family protein [Brevibacillus dissolubilis]